MSNERAENQSEPGERYKRSIVEQWNRNYPVGSRVSVRLKDGSFREMVTRTGAELFEGNVPAVGLEGADGFFPLEICTPKIPKELEFMLERHTAEDVRKAWESLRAEHDDHGIGYLWALVKHWKLKAETAASDEEKETYLQCAKQLRQRAEWIQEGWLLHDEMLDAAPHLFSKRRAARA